MGKHLETPRLKRAEEQAKITIYFDKETNELYRKGKLNGFDVSEIVRRAAREALHARRDILLNTLSEKSA